MWTRKDSLITEHSLGRNIVRIIGAVIAILGIAALFCALLARGAEFEVSPSNSMVSPHAPKSPLNAQNKPRKGIWEGYPLLERIAACESTGDRNGVPRQFNSDGSLLWGNDPHAGKPIKRDLGVLQINTWVWAGQAKELGFDLKTEEGNIAFGKWLYEKYGTEPWTPSEGCWG